MLRVKRAIGRVIVDTRDIRQDEREQLLQAARTAIKLVS